MNSKHLFAIILSLCLFLSLSLLHAQAPQLLNYQGKLMKDGITASGSFSMTFSIYPSETGETALWTETQNVTVTNGIFNILLGSVENFPDTLFIGQVPDIWELKLGKMKKWCLDFI